MQWQYPRVTVHGVAINIRIKMAKHKYEFIIDESSGTYYDDINKLKKIINVDNYALFVDYLFNDVLRYKHKEDLIVENYGEHSLDLIDDLRKKIIEFMEENNIPLE